MKTNYIFEFLDKSKLTEILPTLFDILYNNMNKIDNDIKEPLSIISSIFFTLIECNLTNIKITGIIKNNPINNII